VTELPYQVNKALLVARIADLAKDKRIDGISDIRDESDLNGMRIVIEIKKERRIKNCDTPHGLIFRFSILIY